MIGIVHLKYPLNQFSLKIHLHASSRQVSAMMSMCDCIDRATNISYVEETKKTKQKQWLSQQLNKSLVKEDVM